MPVYNAERYVAEAVESILSQTLADFEFIIIDDGSTDRSLALLESFAAKDGRVRLSSRPNTGYVEALNEALAQAGSPLVARMDADDVSLPQRFARQTEYLQHHPDCLAVGSGVALIDPDGAVLCDEVPPLAHAEIEARLLQGLGGLAHPSAMIRREALMAVGGYRKQCYGAEDKDLWLRLGERGLLANVPDILLKYRVHDDNFTFRNYERGLEALRTAVVEAYRRRGLSCPSDALAAVPAPMSPGERRRTWAWSAVHAGHFGTARKHALALLRERCWARDSWVLMAYAVLGPRAKTLRRLYRRLTRRV